MNEELFRERLIQLRMAKNVSEREMSLALGQSESYINKIENGKALPSMQIFFYICEYFAITPKTFFDDGVQDPVRLQALVEDLKGLDSQQLESLHTIVRGLKK